MSFTADDMRRWQKLTYGSPLYHHVAGCIADSDELMRVVDRIEHQPPPNLFLGGVQFLLMKGEGPELAAYYPSVSSDPLPFDDIEPRFTDFVLEHEEELVKIGNLRSTQTNECRRCVALLPAIWAVGPDSFHLIDVGTSAGLNLAIDHYRYRWNGIGWGPESAVVLETESRGIPPRPRDFEVLTRIGLDLNPIDLGDPDERLWLEALVWPEHHDRRERLKRAIEVASDVEKTLIPGDALETLEATLDGLPGADPAVVMNSFVLNQLTRGQRKEVATIVERARRRRPVHRVSMELPRDWAELVVDRDSGPVEIGRAHPHGEWIELYTLP